VEGLLFAIAGWLGGLISASILDRRAHRRYLRGVANALLPRIRRIRRELDLEGGFGKDAQMTRVPGSVPTVHSRIKELVAQPALLEPAVVEDLMALERCLTNLDTMQKALHNAREAGDEIEKEKQRDEEWHRIWDGKEPDDSGVDAAIQQTIPLLIGADRTKNTEKHESQLAFVRKIAEKRVRSTLDQLEARLLHHISSR
jgi:hypothetical protein